MNFTVFNTPIIKHIFKLISAVVLYFSGWKFTAKKSFAPKAVVIAAPHTSNWDFVWTILMAFKIDLEIRWMGKDSLFKGPFGWFMKWLGGVPVNRSKSNNLVARVVEKFNEEDEFIILIPPEGTRSKVNRWKTGFYHIAHNANVPILMGFLDFKYKVGGIGPAFVPTGNIKEDLEVIKGFYTGISGKYPEKAVLPNSDLYVSLDGTSHEAVDTKTAEFTPSGDVSVDTLVLQAYYASMVNDVKPGTFKTI